MKDILSGARPFRIKAGEGFVNEHCKFERFKDCADYDPRGQVQEIRDAVEQYRADYYVAAYIYGTYRTVLGATVFLFPKSTTDERLFRRWVSRFEVGSDEREGYFIYPASKNPIRALVVERDTLYLLNW